jgi:hypothetical protein
MIYKYEFTNSSMLSSCEYDSDTEELSVEFSNGRIYTYTGVDKNIYDEMINNKSAGKYFNSIKKELTLK